jgi:hypothetical protein
VLPTTRIAIDLSPEAVAVLNDLVRYEGGDLSAVFRKALSLYKFAREAHEAGKSVGIAATPECLEERFVGF